MTSNKVQLTAPGNSPLFRSADIRRSQPYPFPMHTRTHAHTYTNTKYIALQSVSCCHHHHHHHIGFLRETARELLVDSVYNHRNVLTTCKMQANAYVSVVQGSLKVVEVVVNMVEVVLKVLSGC